GAGAARALAAEHRGGSHGPRGLDQAVRAEPRGDRVPEREDRRVHQEARAKEAGGGRGGSAAGRAARARRAPALRRPRGRDRAVSASAAPRPDLIALFSSPAAPAYNRAMLTRAVALGISALLLAALAPGGVGAVPVA